MSSRADDRRRDRGGGPDGGGRVHARGDRAPHNVEQGGRAARQGSVAPQPRHGATDGNGPGAQLVVAVRQPGGAIESVTRSTFSAPTSSNTIRTVSGSRCTPSAMSSTAAVPDPASRRQAATGPGLRWCSGGIPLNRCVTVGRDTVSSPDAASSSAA